MPLQNVSKSTSNNGNRILSRLPHGRSGFRFLEHPLTPLRLHRYSLFMTDISRAIAAKQAAIKLLQADVEALHRATTIIGGKTATPPKTRKRRKMSASARKSVAKRMKAYWAARRKAKK